MVHVLGVGVAAGVPQSIADKDFDQNLIDPNNVVSGPAESSYPSARQIAKKMTFSSDAFLSGASCLLFILPS